MTTRTITPTERLTVVKHLAAGKAHHVVATIARLNVKVVTELGEEYGYPDREQLSKAAAQLEQEIEDAAAPPIRPERTIAPTTPVRPAAGDSTPPAAGTPLSKPDEIRILLNTAKGHPAKRIQAAADRIFDGLDKLRLLIKEDEEKHAEQRRLAAEKAAARAEVDRLKAQLAEAQAKLRGSTTAGGAHTTATNYDRDRTKAIRSWATEQGIEIAGRGRIPAEVSAAYDMAHPAENGDAA